MRKAVFAFVVLSLGSGYCLAQGVDPAKLATVQKDNAAKLRGYTWKQRIELILKGESKKIMLNQVRYDVNGKEQKTPLSTGEPPAQAQQGGRRGRIKAKVIENKKEEFKEMMEGLAALVQSYAHIPPEALKEALSQKKVSLGQGAMQGTAGVHLADVLEKGDSLTVWVDTATLLFRRIEINTSFEKKPVKVVADYSTLPHGPNYMAKANLQYPAQELQLKIDTFEHLPATQ